MYGRIWLMEMYSNAALIGTKLLLSCYWKQTDQPCFYPRWAKLFQKTVWSEQRPFLVFGRRTFFTLVLCHVPFSSLLQIPYSHWCSCSLQQLHWKCVWSQSKHWQSECGTLAPSVERALQSAPAFSVTFLLVQPLMKAVGVVVLEKAWFRWYVFLW